MNRYVIIFLAAVLSFSLVSATWAKDKTCTVFNSRRCHLDNLDIDTDNDVLVIKFDDRCRSVVKITDDCELYVNGKYVETTPEQQELVREFHDGVLDIVGQAEKVGVKGAGVGLDGAKLGFKAVIGLLRTLRTDYDMDDLEEDLDYEAAKLEDRARELEDWAEELEETAEDLESVYLEMKGSIPELRDL
jgi:hypothetical protein